MTLTDALARAAAEAPGQGILHLGPPADRFVSYAELYADALRIGGGLHAAGLAPGDPLMIVTEDSADFLALFWGAIVAGVVPVPMPPEPHRLAAVRAHLGNPRQAGGTTLSARDLRSALPLQTPIAVRPDDLAFLQFSSGSTGTPKGVELTHANVLANLTQATRSGQLHSGDVFLTWMPYFHDMGLIGTHLAPLHNLCRQIRISPLTFAKRPETWLRLAAEHRATVLSAANFALALTNRRVPGEVLDSVDLSSVRLLMVGAEPISPSVWRTFTTRMTRAGLSPGAVQPVYGLAEATVAVTSPPMGETAVPVRLHRAALSRGVAVPAPAATSSPVEFMDVGHPVPGCELRIVDDEGLPLEDGLVGHIQLRGPNVTHGYHRAPEATADLFDGPWLRTGDLGFLRAGRLCVTGRHKDVLFVNGRNFHAADLEEVAAATPGLNPGPIAVVGAPDPDSGREQVAVFVAAPAVRPDPPVLTALIRSRVAEALAYDRVHVEVVPSGTFTRTTSGKLRRHPFRDRLTTPPSPSVPPSTPSVLASPTAPPPAVATLLPVPTLPAVVIAPSASPVSRTGMERIVREIWAGVLRIPAATIGPDDRFLAIGGSSLGAMEVLAALEDRFSRTFEPAMLRDCATVTALADHLLAAGAVPRVDPTPTPISNAAAAPSAATPAASVTPTTCAPAALPAPGGDVDRVAESRGLAVIGMACRFPGADSPEEFWDDLLAGRDSVTTVNRWPGGGHGAFLDDPAGFDAEFFGIDEDEARLLDPHARIFLELAHEALERSGYAGPRRHGRRIGVFAAVGESAYPELVTAAGAGDGPHALTGTLRNLIAARVAHLLDLHGPAVAVDTACSSALVAVHLARRSLEAGDCDIAVVGGVNLNLTATGETLLAQAQALSPTGRCRAFAAGADGFVPGEGGAALVLTRLADVDGDRILAVVRGSAVNNDGRSLSLMAPNPLRQQQVIADAYRDSGVDPAEVTYLEAHGTGTVVGDPIEARSLAHAFPPLAGGRLRLLGSVKTNIGHLLNVAGLPALVKVILALQHRRVPPSLHHDRPSPRFDLAAAGFQVATEAQPWTAPHTAGINGFGFGGTNAHVILSAAPAPAPAPVVGEPVDGPCLLTLSARSAVALRAAAAELAAHLREHPELRTADVCATAAAARDDGPYRLALVTGKDLPGRLAAVQPGPPVSRPARVVFVFGGPDPVRPGTGEELYRNAPVFRTVLDEVSAAAGLISGRPLTAWCTDPGVPAEDLAAPEVTAPLLVAVGVALSAQLAAHGIRPDAVTGWGPAELAAASVAGHLTPVEAVLLARHRADGTPGPLPAPRPGTIPLFSSRTGEWLTRFDAEEARPGRVVEVVDRLRAAGFDTLVEVGARATLLSPVRGPAAGTASDLLAMAGTLWQRGARLDRTVLDAGTIRVDLPAYPFQRRRHWITDRPETTAGSLSVPLWTAAPRAHPPVEPQGERPVEAQVGTLAADRVVHAGDGGVAAALAAITAVPGNARLLLVTRDLYAVDGGTAHPRHAVWAGLAMAFADENRAAAVRIVDLSSSDSKKQRRAALAVERTMPLTAGPAEVVAWRGGRRSAREFVPAPAPVRRLVPPADGSYLIVGGAGAAGTVIARDLARRGRPRLLLAGRSAEPVALLDELRSLGATADYLVTDVTAPDQVAALVAGRRFDVVVQAAGTVRPGSLRSKTPAEVSAGLAAKVRGTKLLTRALAARHTADGTAMPLVVALSSVSSVLPGLAGAVGDYVAGNLYLDSFAASRRAAGQPFVAINLPALAGAGLAAGHAVDTDGLPIERLPDVLWAAVALDTPQVLVTPAPSRSVPASTSPGPAELRRETPASVPTSASPGRAGPRREASASADRSTKVAVSAGPDRAALVGVLREMLAGPLEREPDSIGVDEPFLTLGLDSLTAVDLVKDLETRLGRTLSTTLFFEHRSIGELAGHLAGPGVFGFSPVQQAFVTTGRLYPEISAYAYVRQSLSEPVDTIRLGAAFAELERRHPMLRVRFGPDGQHFGPAPTGPPVWFSTADGPVEEIDAEARNRPFDLTREAPIRAVLAGSELIVVVHHAAADGFSLAVLGDELWALYRGAAPGAEPATTFADHEARRTPPTVTDRDHWQAVLAGWPGLALPYDGDAGAEPRGPYAVHQRVLDEETTRALTVIARTAEVSVFHLLLAVYARCLAAWSGQNEVPVSVARAGRTARLPGIDRMVGPFADTLPLLAGVRPAESVTALAARLRDSWLVAEQHGSISTVDVARMLAAGTTGPRTASPASFSFARFPGTGTTTTTVRATTAGTASASTRLGLVCFEAHGTLHFSWNYPSHLFTPQTIERLATYHLTEIHTAAGGVVASDEVATTGVVARIREQCRRTPDVIAVLTDGVPLTYRELDVMSDRLASRLAVAAAAVPGTVRSGRIGLLTGQGADTVIGVVGILKAGAGWVPVDATHPPARLASQLERAGAGVVVCDPSTRDAAKAIGLPFIDIAEAIDIAETGVAEAIDIAEAGVAEAGSAASDSRGNEGTESAAAEGLDVGSKPGDTAYVIFTSGSTGRPKGVAGTHHSMINYLDWAITTFGYRQGDRLAQTASICFDASVRQILAPLLVGATVVAWDRDTVRDPELLAERLERDEVTVWSSVPTLWERLLSTAEKPAAGRIRNGLSRLRWVHVGGEELSPAHVRRWFDLLGPGQRITNLYGPTETTINATWHLIDSRPADDVTRLPIGRPVGGATIEVVDGEIQIGGVGLAAGYLDDQEQTSKAFVVRGGRRWYRSGDRGHLDTDGVLWFRGRLDDQVKLNGHRIEPAEVEEVLRRHPSVERVAVGVEAGRLIAWVQSTAIEAPALRAHLRTLLPDYLIPGRIHLMPVLPLTPTGKIDRTALSGSSRNAPAEPTAPAEPMTPTELLLAELWKRQLGVGEVGRGDDFFALGGDSIGVLDLFAALADHRPALPRPTVLYHHRTLAALATTIDAVTADDEVGGARADGGDHPVSPTQRGFLLADAVGAPSTWLAAPRLRGPLDPDRFQQAVDLLVDRHPMLRTVFPKDTRPPVQREIAAARLTVGYTGEPGPVAEELAAEREHRFDPAEWPLVRLRLLRYGPDEHVLMVHAHHLVGDGYSVDLLMRELLAVYDGETLPALRSTFRDYVSLLDTIEPEVAPHDGEPFPAGGEIATAGVTIPERNVRELQRLAADAGVTSFVPVLVAFRQALTRVLGDPDPTIGVAVTGRDHSLRDLTRIFGPCATAVAVRVPGATLSETTLSETAAAVIEARSRTFTAPHGWRYFFTHLRFNPAPEGRTLSLTWDDADADLAVPPGTEVLLAARPVEGGLRLTLRGRLPQDRLDRLARAMQRDLSREGVLDAALVGYLPSPALLHTMATALPSPMRELLPALDRESLRALLFPGGRPRLVETVQTPVGRSGFVAVPRFADELGADGLARDVAAGVDLAAELGARTVSLAGMIPALTGYGTALRAYRQSGVDLTTGHAVTAASVVRTTVAALASQGRELRDCVVAILGVGSIGTSSLRLLLARAPEPPAGLILCDLPSAAGRLTDLAQSLEVPVEIATDGPDAVYRADVIVAATSGGPGTLDVDRLKPGTILVDDSFPHCFDTARALTRMRERGDVLIVGGGLLDCGETRRTAAEGLPAIDTHLPGSIASCQLESLLHATVPGLPLVTGPVQPEQAAAYWTALETTTIAAAPLHLLNQRLHTEGDVEAVPVPGVA
ncbi:MAG TPA: amino acid adenylation domain-containing protein [Actinoplanes sp.]|nr:amino acid adenylation domain-containing protein [Actinoplanes sp.]